VCLTTNTVPDILCVAWSEQLGTENGMLHARKVFAISSVDLAVPDVYVIQLLISDWLDTICFFCGWLSDEGGLGLFWVISVDATICGLVV